MVANLPAGLFITRRLGAALIVGQIALAAGALVIASADGFGLLFAGRALMGIGHSLSMLASLTALLHAYAGDRLSVALNAVEFSAMIGLLAGAGLAAVLPSALSWKNVLLLSCIPQGLALVLLPMVVRRMPSRGDRAGLTTAAPPASRARSANLVPLAFAAGTVVAIAYSSVEQLVIPVRGSREF